MVEEIIAAFKVIYQQNNSTQNLNQQEYKGREELKQLHQEFDWLVADIGVKEPLTRSNIYCVE